MTDDKQFFSQFGEDEFLVGHGLVPRRGVFVDVGAGKKRSAAVLVVWKSAGEARS